MQQNLMPITLIFLLGRDHLERRRGSRFTGPKSVSLVSRR